MTTQKLTGLHAQLFPALIDTGFQVFSIERIKLIKSLIDTGSLTKPGTHEPTRKALEILPLCLNFGSLPDTFQSFNIYIRNNQVVAGWNSDSRFNIPLFEAVQRFELRYKPLSNT